MDYIHEINATNSDMSNSLFTLDQSAVSLTICTTTIDKLFDVMSQDSAAVTQSVTVLIVKK